ncbi:MAG: type II secretion system protein [Patescibacteria group bacterium]
MWQIQKSERAFTLIELLVVIAIIGLLAASIVASLVIARGKAGDARVQHLMSNLRAGMEFYYASHANSYGAYSSGATSGVCPVAGSGSATSAFPDTVSGTYDVIRSLKQTQGVSVTACFSNSSSWVVGAVLPSDPTGSYWCVDSRGAAKAVSATLATNSLGPSLCP